MQFILRLVVLTCLVANVIKVHAQLTVNAFLQSVYQDETYKTLDEQVQYLESRPYKLSPFQKVEFRTTNNQLDASRQDYALRVNPANPWEVKSNNTFYAEVQKSLQLEKSIVVRKALVIRYQMVIDYFYDESLWKLKLESKRLLDAQAHVLERQGGSDFFDAEDVVKIKLDQLDALVALDELSFERIKHIQTIQQHAGVKDTLTWQHDELISIAKIKAISDSIVLNVHKSAWLAYKQSKITLAEREYALEKSNINMGFLQTQYEGYRTEQKRAPWSISLGITIPITNPNKGDMTKRKLEVIAATHAFENSKQEKTFALSNAQADLHNLIKRYDELEGHINSIDSSSLPTLLGTIKNNNPMATIRYANNVLKLRALQLKLAYSIRLSYIELLANQDVLQEMPIVNYLSAALELVGNE